MLFLLPLGFTSFFRATPVAVAVAVLCEGRYFYACQERLMWSSVMGMPDIHGQWQDEFARFLFFAKRLVSKLN